MEVILLWLIAGLMAAFTAWLLKEGSSMKTENDAAILLFLLSMMVTMVASTVAYFYDPGYTTLYVLCILNMVTMSAFLVPVLELLPKGDKPIDGAFRGSHVSAKTLVVVIAIAMAILSEVFMGWTFALAGGVAQASAGIHAIYTAMVVSSSSYWFIFTMSFEMAIALLFIRKRLPKGVGWILAAQVLVMFLSPTAISNASWADFSLFAGGVAMILMFIYIIEFLHKSPLLSPGTMNYLLGLMLAYALMMAGIFLWLMDGDASIFVLSLVVEMAVYFYVVFEEEKLSSSKMWSWHSMPYWVFAFLSLLFVAEFFMGGALDIYAYGTSYFTGISLASVSGPPLGALAAALYNFLTLFASVTASPWYLIMMGVEMGSLVLFKIRDARELETKVRLAMVIVAYALYTVFLPVFVLSASLPKIPWVGWSMGLGTAGAVAPAVILALLSTYLISGALSFLFGSRNVCSLFCSAALMYQGTTIDSMSTFNRTSKVGRRFLTSKISSAYRIVTSVVWASLLGAAILSYLNSVGVVSFSVFGTDPSFLLYSFYFSFLWYIIWIMIPFVGTYGCATTGMCGWGSFNQLVSRLGFFRLKAKDKEVCWSCKTKDCAKVCPVGITNQPAAFMAKGQLRSFKCIGVGDCVTACPYGNIYFFDVRRWMRERLRSTKAAPVLREYKLVIRRPDIGQASQSHNELESH